MNVDTNLTRTDVTGGDGRFEILALPPGTYRVSAALAGFVTDERKDMAVTLGSQIALAFVLRAQGATETIVVTADAPLIDPQKTAVATVIRGSRSTACRSTDATSSRLRSSRQGSPPIGRRSRERR